MSDRQGITAILKDYLFDPITCEKHWNDLIQLKNALWLGDVKSVEQCTYLHSEIAASWIRSYKYGVNPTKPVNAGSCRGRRLQPKKEWHPDLEKVIELSKPVIDSFFQCTKENSYTVSLDDPSGYPLLIKGNRNLWKLTMRTLISTSEAEKGTNMHALVRRLKYPVLLQGPQNYNIEEQDRFVCGAPIFDSEGNVIAILVLSQLMPPQPWNPAFQAICSHILSLLNSMAFAIQNQVLLDKSIRRQQEILNKFYTTNRMLSTIVNIGNDGIAIINSDYHFLNINRKAKQWFAIDDEDIEELDIRGFLANPERFEELVNTRKNAEIEDVIIPSRKVFQFEVFPIEDQLNEIHKGAVLKINNVECINTAAAKRAGTQAVYTFDSLIGKSPKFQLAVRNAKKFACLPENVLLIGESGTGKELFAQALHNEYRPNGPFVAINCAAMPRDLIASELFGYESGSFTGADKKGRPGKFELAQNGTIFLDEIGDMPIELQSTLLRVLQNREVTRLGAKRSFSVNCRIIAATNKNLLGMIQDGTFREDLYYRLSILKVIIPPLRERKDDIELLADYFLENYCRRIRVPRKRISPEAMKIMLEYDWPGNVRQLENAIIYSVNTCSGDTIESTSLPPDILVGKPYLESTKPDNSFLLASARCQIDISDKAIKRALANTNNNISQAAFLLGVSRSTLYRRLRTMGYIKNGKRARELSIQ